MSFGFSVGDFIAIADKAYLVYKRCKDAPGKHAELTKRVLQLREVLDETKLFLEQADQEGQIPQSQLRLASLNSMRTGCDSTLNEVDDFLEKYSNFGTETGTRRMISRLKFINSDSSTLIRKLEIDASSLQLRLTSLTGLSVLNIQTALQRIAQEYRTGVRQPSVISHPRIDNEPVEREDMFEQISQDLEEEDIHPDAINLNRPFLDEWLSRVIEDDGLDEGSSHPLPNFDRTIPRIETISSALTTDDVIGGASEADEPPRDDLSQPVSPISTFQELNVANRIALRAEDSDSLYAGPDNVTIIPEDSITVIESGFTLGASGEPLFRSGSTASSAGKPENWHPYNRPAPDYVREKLHPLFHEDPIPDPSSGTTKHRIMRAFHQADYSDGGFLNRGTVSQHLSAVLAHSPLKIDADTLEGIIHSFDANHDAQFDDDEFLGLVQELMRRTSQANEMRIEATFATIVQEAKAKAARRRAMDSKFFLHWGFSKQPGARNQYIDDILHVPVETPPKVLEGSAFSVMAWEANICVDRISDFEEMWIGIVPNSMQGEYRNPLRNVQRIARAFTLLENQSNRFSLSDLDAYLVCIRIASGLLAHTEAEGANVINAKLEDAKSKCSFILDALLGFTDSLDRKINFDASVHNFGKFQAWWKDNHLCWRSDTVLNESIDWNHVEDAVATFRTQGHLARVEHRARIVVEDFTTREINRVQRRQAQILATPWVGTIVSARIYGWSKNWVSKTIDTRKVFLRISVNEPMQVFDTSSEKRAESTLWGFTEAQQDKRIYLLPTSTITIAVMYVDNRRAEGYVQKFKFPPRRPADIDFTKRTGHHLYDRGVTIRYAGPPCNADLRLVMDDSPEFDKELGSPSVKDWRTLLFDQPTEAAGPPLETTTLATPRPVPAYIHSLMN